MPTKTDPEEIARLYAALNERILAKDKEGTTQRYSDLLAAGRPLSEILDRTGEAMKELWTLPVSGNTVNWQESPGSAHPAPAPPPEFRRIATAWPSPISAMLVVSGIITAATIGFLIMHPVAQEIAAGGPPASGAVVGAPAETSPTAAASATSPVTVQSVSAAAMGTAPIPAAAPAEPVLAALPSPASSTPEAPPAVAPAEKMLPDQPRLAAAEITALLARGDSLLGVGDVVSARLFYKRATDAGNGRAALRLGATYDPGFLRALIRIHPFYAYGDAAQALSWYRRASGLGESEAEHWIQRLDTNSGR